ncbi:MAG: hypothetical protein ABSH12_09820, partial [Endomicrobiales bacterium]
MPQKFQSRIPSIPHTFRPETVSQALGFFIAAAGSAVLGGWFLSPWAQSILPHCVPMKANTAFCFVFIGIALVLLNNKKLSNRLTLIATDLSACVVFAIGFITVCEYACGWNAFIDNLIVQGSHTTILAIHPGRMAFNSAINFVLIGAALAMIPSGKRLLIYVAQIMVLIAAITSLFAFTGYLYGANPYIMDIKFCSTVMALVLFLASCFSFFLARPRTGLMNTVTSKMSGGRMIRIIWPIVILIPISVDWLKLTLLKHGFVSDEISVALVAIINLTVVSSFIYIFASLVNKHEHEL